MAHGVVDQLEPVQVNEQHGHLLVAGARGGQRLGQAQLAQGAVGQLGQHIVLGQKADALFFGFAVGDVDGNANQVRRCGGVALAHRRHHQPGGVGLARLAPETHLALPGIHVGQGCPVGALAFQQKPHFFAQHLVILVTCAAAERGIHTHHLALRVHDDDAF